MSGWALSPDHCRWSDPEKGVMGRSFSRSTVPAGAIGLPGIMTHPHDRQITLRGTITIAGPDQLTASASYSTAMSDTRYLALFTGINVGRAKRIAMADLRRVLGEFGYHEVATHLQSGNAVFTAEADAGTVAAAVHHLVQAELGVDAEVVVRTARQLTAAIAADPFADVADDPAKHLLGFFSAVPDAARLANFRTSLESQQLDPEVAGLQRIADDHCYLWCPQGVLKSPFGTIDWTRKLGVAVTMRNWKTALRLAEMLAG